MTTANNTKDAPEIYWDPFDSELNMNPYPVWKRMREECPLYYNARHDFYALSRYDDVAGGLADHETFISSKGAMLEFIQSNAQMPNGYFIFEDPPIHTMHRGVLASVFTPRKMEALEPRIRRFTAACLEPQVGKEGFDLIKELGAVMPISVIGMMLGIPEEDTQKVREKIDDSLRTSGDGGVDTEFMSALDEGFDEYIDWRINNPSDDLMTQIMKTEFTDNTGKVRTLDREEITSIVHVLAGAGNETTNRFIGWAGKLLAEHPDQLKQLADDPSLIPQAMEEILRFNAPGPSIARYSTKDVEYYGQVIPAGSAVVFLVGSANRDESRFINGDKFDIHREKRPHITFGSGIHTCIGAALTRLEGRVALEELIKRFPHWKVDIEHAEIVASSSTRGYESLPIYFGDKPLPVAQSATANEDLPPATAEGLAGEWTITVKGPTGPMVTRMVISFDNGQLSGTQSGEGADPTPIREMVLDGNDLNWKNEFTQPMKIKVDFSAQVAGDTMSGTVKAGFMGKYPFVATKGGTASKPPVSGGDSMQRQGFFKSLRQWIKQLFV